MSRLDLFSTVFENRKILLTGHTGFKGSWLSIWLRELGAEVYGYSLEPYTNRDNFVSTNLATKINHQVGDVRDQKALFNYFQEVKPDIAFHLAAQPLVIESYTNPHNNFETNLMGTVNFFEAVRNCSSVKVAINVTTDKCYKNNEWLWGYRENDPMGGDDPYSASKRCSELITHSYIKSFFEKEGTANVASGRAGNVIGGGDWAEYRILPDIIRSFMNNEKLEIRNPYSVRPWQFVLEPIFGYLKLAEKLWFDGKTYSGGWNFGPKDFENHSVREVVEEVKKIIPTFQIVTPKTQEKLHEASLLKLDITKAICLLDWKPKLSFEETIQFTIEGYLAELNQKDIYASRVAQIEAYSSK